MNNITLPFDQYQRYKAIADIIKSINIQKGFSLIDIGSGAGKLSSKFIGNAKITFLDKSIEEDKFNECVIKEDILEYKLEKDSYDIVISVDAFEHIEERDRYVVLDKLYNAAKQYLIIAAPFDTELVKDIEDIAYESGKILSGFKNTWLMEHKKYGLPNLDKTIKYLENKKCSFSVIGNGNLFRWEKMLNFNIASLSAQGDEDISKSVNKIYNKYVYRIDHSEPTYRKIIIVSKKKKDANSIAEYIKKQYIDANKEISMKVWDILEKEIDYFYRAYGFKGLKNNIDDLLVKNYKKIYEEKEKIVRYKEKKISDLENKIKNYECIFKEKKLKDNEVRKTIRYQHILIKKYTIDMERYESKIEDNKKEIEKLKGNNANLLMKKNIVEKEYLNENIVLKENLKDKKREIKTLRESTSWRITIPIRLLGNIYKNAKTRMLNFNYILMKKTYRSSILPIKVKEMIAGLIRLRFRYLIRSIPKKEKNSFKNDNNDGISIYGIQQENTINNFKDIKFDVVEKPDVSIIIPVYGKIQFTINCLRSITKLKTKYKYQIIIINDNSPDNSLEILPKIKGIKIISNKKNVGFLTSCNIGASESTGKYIIFLNNDTIVQEKWLDELVDTLNSHKDVGLVGSKLIYPDGRLQEAGGIIWTDGSGWNYGRFDDPNKPEYNYAREVDYCSGASICILRDFFLEVKGFDELFAPAYFEDADLAFKVREKNKKVVYQPLSTVVHYEGISCGKDINEGHKKYQVKNAEKFCNKWINQLKLQEEPGKNVIRARQRNLKKKILVIDERTPTPDKDAGSVTAFQYLKIITELGYQVTFIPSSNLLRMEKYTCELQRIGIECIYSPYIEDIENFLKNNGKAFDIVMLYRANCAYRYIYLVKRFCKHSKIIFNTVDLHYLRLERQAKIEKSTLLKKEAFLCKKKELCVIEKSDFTIVLSSQERNILKKEIGSDNKIVEIPLIMEIPGINNPYAKRKGIIFIGGYEHLPNVDAVMYFAKEIFPIIKSEIEDIVFYIIGSNAPKKICELDKIDGINYIGYIEDLNYYFNNCKISVVPVRYGAGIKGKIGTSLSYGVPVVSTSIGSEGMGLRRDINVLIGDTPEDFAKEVIRIYNNEKLWSMISKNGLEFIENNYSVTVGKQKINNLLEKIIDHKNY